MTQLLGLISPQILGESDITHGVTAVDTDFGLAVKYIGAQASGTVTVSATDSDMTFKHGVLASEAVDATIDTGGDDEGVLDVSDITNTMGALVDTINASTNWDAMLIGCRREDIAVDCLETMSATQAKVNANKDVLINYWGGIAVERTTATKYRTAGTSALAMGLVISNKDLDGNNNFSRKNVLALAELSCTNGGTTEVNRIRVYKVNDDTGVSTQIFVKTLGSDPSAVVIDDADFGDLLVSVPPGYGILVRLDADAATTTATLTVPTFFVVGGHQDLPTGAMRGKWNKADM